MTSSSFSMDIRYMAKKKILQKVQTFDRRADTLPAPDGLGTGAEPEEFGGLLQSQESRENSIPP
jgi:hypothetical protein